MGSELLDRLNTLWSDLKSIGNFYAVMAGFGGFAIQNHISWRTATERGLAIFVDTPDIENIGYELESRGWYVRFKPGQIEVYVNSQPISFYNSNTKHILNSVRKRTMDFNNVKIINAPALLLHHLLYMDLVDMVHNLKNPIDTALTKKILYEAASEINTLFDPLTFGVVENRLENFKTQQKKKFK